MVRLAVAPDPPAAPAVPADVPGRHRGPPVLPPLIYTTIACQRCGAAAGQVKYHPAPGLRDGPSWYLRVWDPASGGWGNKRPHRTVLRENAERTEVWARQWVQDHRTCCPDEPS